MQSKTQSRGPETVTDALERMDPEARAPEDAAYAAEPTWRRRALDPEAEGVALRWRVGKDLTGVRGAR